MAKSKPTKQKKKPVVKPNPAPKPKQKPKKPEVAFGGAKMANKKKKKTGKA
jgi:hypothetical protein